MQTPHRVKDVLCDHVLGLKLSGRWSSALAVVISKLTGHGCENLLTYSWERYWSEVWRLTRQRGTIGQTAIQLRQPTTTIYCMSPVKSCSLDPVPTFLVREYVDVLLPYITRMVNASLSQGRLPVSQKHAIVTRTAMETDALLLQVRGCWTICQLIWDKLTLTLNSLNGS